MSKQARLLVSEFFNDLEKILVDHDELMDTDVRESLHLTINYFFIWGKQGCIPKSYGMFSFDGDKAVNNAVKKFVDSIRSCSDLSSVPVGKERLLIIQNGNIKTAGGYQYDDFIGHVEEPLPSNEELPASFYESGDYD